MTINWCLPHMEGHECVQHAEALRIVLSTSTSSQQVRMGGANVWKGCIDKYLQSRNPLMEMNAAGFNEGILITLVLVVFF